MISAEFRRARAILGLSDDALAAELGVTPAVIRAWDSGSTAIPTRFAQHLSWLAARAQRDAALAVSGLPVCAWMTSRPEQRLDANARELAAEAERVMDHVKACPICVARDRFVLERFGPMPEPPVPAWLRILSSVERLPAWARPAAVGAAVIAAIVGLRLVFALPELTVHPARLADALAALAIAAAAGACGGFAYSLTRPSFIRLGRAGDYLSGVVSVFAYMSALALVAPYAFGEALIEKQSDWLVFSIAALVFGLVVGHTWFGPSRKG